MTFQDRVKTKWILEFIRFNPNRTQNEIVWAMREKHIGTKTVIRLLKQMTKDGSLHIETEANWTKRFRVRN